MIDRWLGSSSPQIWAVEDTALQITWGDLPAGPVTATVPSSATDTQRSTVEHRGGAGAIELVDLPSNSSLSIELSWAGGSQTLRAQTLATPPGRQLSRFATISDLHLGARRWGAMKTMTEAKMGGFNTDLGFEPSHPYRCAVAAIAEAVRWGAQALIIKGDAAQHESRADFEQVGQLVDEFPDLKMLLVPGNHDVDGRPGSIPSHVGARQLAYTRKIDLMDLPGIRVIAADTTIPGEGHGTVERIKDAVVDAVSSSNRPVYLGLHHQLQMSRLPRYWPIGVPASEAVEFLDDLDRLPQPVLISSGHTHRNRTRKHGGVAMTEVGSTKDWPGVWAGYAVHEGGIRQVVKRVAAPDAIAWTEYSRKAVGGLWGRWSPGPLGQRCWSRSWPNSNGLLPDSQLEQAER